ncbi:sugar ABC transporter permease [Flexivirga endophytica]|uniref:Maltose/maltodextrin transport system permease protein n=1 Tax=Flexivirga endophytica TaxID=1849103 RepID=A0A916WZ52_9MICO|nr:ABC transporter permease subunit [Flexivirga endophytica]GGB43743.1 sugar ABC transporter permease [Flexivirga endophytica]GHB68109.1 sugar ABC transporter permease [Flexivirga endophytica]
MAVSTETSSSVIGSSPARTPVWALALKWVAIAAALLLALYVASKLADHGHTLAVVGTAFVAMCVLVIYGTRRAVPMKYLFVGLALLIGLQVWPIVYTAMTAFTNYGQGHLASKEDATAQDIAYSVRQVPGSPTYTLTVAVKDGTSTVAGPLYFLLVDEKGHTFVGDAKGLNQLGKNGLTIDAGKITKAEGYTTLNLLQANKRKDLSSFAVPTDGGGGIKASGFAAAYNGKPTLVWDKKADTITDTTTKQVYVAEGAQWVPQSGKGDALPVGWKENVGLANFRTLFTNSTIRDGFLGIFAWNIAFSVLSVLTTFVLGMLLALLLNDSRIKGRGIYRSLLILPYAIPVFVSALVWASMFNQQFGLINNLTHLNIDWFGSPWAARAAVLITNLWLGFPYMFVVCTGALQSLPGDVMEAAKIDGAGAWRTLRSITTPLLLVAVGPLLIASFAFNFNNFGLIYLLTKGGPFTGGNSQLGSTDLLITYAYRLALGGTNPNYGLAGAVAIIIFIIVGLLSFPGFLRSKALEEVN